LALGFDIFGGPLIPVQVGKRPFRPTAFRFPAMPRRLTLMDAAKGNGLPTGIEGKPQFHVRGK